MTVETEVLEAQAELQKSNTDARIRNLEFSFDTSNKIKTSDPVNVAVALARLEVGLRFNTFSNIVEITWRGNHVSYDDLLEQDLASAVWDRFAFLPGIEVFQRMIPVLANKHKYSPLIDYLEALKWDGKKRIDTWLVDFMGAKDSAYTRAVGRLTLEAAVTRALHPGVKFDTMLCLEGPQGSGKSSSLQKGLCPCEEWFTDVLKVGEESKVVIELTRSKWICEISELSGYTTKRIEEVKAFLSRGVDEARAAYGRTTQRRPRSFILIATTNSDKYLADETGGRRFWPVQVGSLQVWERLAEVRDQLWAEAAAKGERSGRQLELPSALWDFAAREQEERKQEEPWLETLRESIAHRKPEQGEIRLSYGEAYAAIGVSSERQDFGTHKRLRNCLAKLGFEHGQFWREKRTFKGWRRKIGEPFLTYEDKEPF